jgi:hypothetical protein
MPDIIQRLRDTYAENPAAVFDKLQELFQQYDEGLIKMLPCKVGDTVYFDDAKHYQAPEDIEPRIREVEVDDITIANPYWKLNGGDEEFLPDDFGKTVFLTREAAEKALERGT